MRLENSFSALAHEALELEVPIFQLFLMPQKKNRYLRLTAEDRETFAALRKQFKQIYVHSSYWINLTSGKDGNAAIAESLLKREIKLAQKLELTSLVIHPGSSKGNLKTAVDPEGKIAGLLNMSRIMNKVLKTTSDVTFLFENTPHGGSSVGSDLNDFILLKTMLDQPEKIGFCLDIAHAFSYGYEVDKPKEFIKLLDQTMGLDQIKLIHLHDSAESFGSKKDRHAIPGQGEIGMATLKNLVTSAAFKETPLILELPPLTPAKINPILDEVRAWK